MGSRRVIFLPPSNLSWVILGDVILISDSLIFIVDWQSKS